MLYAACCLFKCLVLKYAEHYFMRFTRCYHKNYYIINMIVNPKHKASEFTTERLVPWFFYMSSTSVDPGSILGPEPVACGHGGLGFSFSPYLAAWVIPTGDFFPCLKLKLCHCLLYTKVEYTIKCK